MDNCDPGPAAEFARRADRAWLSGLLASGFRDVFRVFYPDRLGSVWDVDVLWMSPVGCARCRESWMACVVLVVWSCSCYNIYIPEVRSWKMQCVKKVSCVML